MAMDSSNIVGIDIGTTSIKVVVMSARTRDILSEYSQPTNSYKINTNQRNEQNMAKIVATLEHCLSLLPAVLLEKVIGIGICGQMHGLICWSSENKPWNTIKNNDNTVFRIDEQKLSAHYSWQDNRCDTEFLNSLPKPDSHLTVHTGYACCTLFWLKKHSPETIVNFDCASTAADFVVTMLCDLKKPKMCAQNAASWGYFDTDANRWNEQILEKAEFPVFLLPSIYNCNHVAGALSHSWHGIPAGVPVGIALGDLQSSILAALDNDREAIVNISTSAQLAYILNDFHPKNVDKKLRAKVVPYFDDSYVCEFAILNGGNALSTFVNNLQSDIQHFGCTIDKDTLWSQLIHDGLKSSADSELLVIPTFLGERHSPNQKGTICNLTTDNFHIINVFRSLCKGIISNINSIVAYETLTNVGIDRIVGTGSALLRNKILQQDLQQLFPIPVTYKSSADAPYGAALAMLKILNTEKLQE